MTKNELIREIYDKIMYEGFNDNKLSEIPGTTRGKMENVVYVKKLITPVDNVDSVSISSMDKTFADACDADVRIAYNDYVVGKRIFIWANEATTEMLQRIYNFIIQ